MTEELKDVLDELKKTSNEIKELSSDEKVIQYNKLLSKKLDLDFKKKQIYEDLVFKRYDSCKHILVYSKIDYDYIEGRSYKSCGCIKCGLDNSIKEEKYNWLNYNEKLMYNYLRKNYLSGINTEIACDLDLANSIYEKIKERNPDIDDETLIKYFRIELENIEKSKKTLKILKK